MALLNQDALNQEVAKLTTNRSSDVRDTPPGETEALLAGEASGETPRGLPPAPSDAPNIPDTGWSASHTSSPAQTQPVSAQDLMADFDKPQAPAAPTGPATNVSMNDLMGDFDTQNGPVSTTPAEAAPETSMQTLKRGGLTGLENLKESAYGTVQWLTNVAQKFFGDNPTFQKINDWAQSGENVAKAAKPPGMTSDDALNAWHDARDNGNFGSLYKSVLFNISNMGVYVGGQALGAFVGGLAMAAFGPEELAAGAVGAAVGTEGAVLRSAAGTWLAKLVETKSAQIAGSAAAATSTSTAIRAAAVKAVTQDLLSTGGKVVGAAATNTAIFTGGARAEAPEAEPTGDDLWRQLAGGIWAAGSSTIMGVLGFNALAGRGMKALGTLPTPARLAGGAVIGAGEGTGGMVAMTAGQRYAENQPLTGEEAEHAYGSAALIGAGFGAVPGAVGGNAARKPATLPVPPRLGAQTHDAVAAIGIGDPSVPLDTAISAAMQNVHATNATVTEFHLGMGRSLQTARENITNAAGGLSADERLAQAASEFVPPPAGTVGPEGSRMLTDLYLQNIEDRGGAALPEEAAHLKEAGAGTPYDRILPAEPLSEPAGARPTGEVPTDLVEQLNSVVGQIPAAKQVLADAVAGRMSIADARKAADGFTGETGAPAFGVPESRTVEQTPNERIAAAAAQAPTPEATPAERLAAAAAPPVTQQTGQALGNAPRPGANVDAGEGRTVRIMDRNDLPAAAPGGYVGGALNRTTAGMIMDMGRRFGKQVSFYAGEKGEADGFVRTDQPNQIYINTNSSTAHLAVFGHELYHLMKRETPEVAAKFEQAVREQLTPDVAERFKASYGKVPGEVQQAAPGKLGPAHFEELSADMMGQSMLKPEFWTHVFDKVGGTTGTSPREVTRLGALVQRTVRMVTQTFGGRGFAAEKYVSDFKSIHDAAAQALQEYAQARDIPAREMEIHRLTAAQEVSRIPLTKRQAEQGGAGQMRGHFEVAPDPKDLVAKAAWDKMSPADKTRVSLVATEKLMPKILRLMGVKGELEAQAGGWKDDQNPSFALKVEDTRDLPRTAKLLGQVFKQEAVGVVADHPFEGSVPHSELRITLPHAMDYNEIGAVYKQLRQIHNEQEGPNGTTVRSEEPIIQGHSTTVEGNDMRVLHNPEESGMSTAALQAAVRDKLGPEYGVESRAVHARFIDQKEYGYEQPDGTALQPARGGAADLLRHEASRVVANEIARSNEGAQRGPEGGNAAQGGGAQRGEPNAAAAGAGRGEVRNPVGEPNAPEPTQALSRARANHAEEPAAPGPNGPGNTGATEGGHGDTITGTHYGQSARTALSGSYYGTGLRGAERSRLERASDERIKSRSYFYVNKGRGVVPELGVGAHAHEARLDAMYNASDNPERIPSGDLNHFESEVLNRGYKGYYTRNEGARQGMAVRLGEHADVPVEHVGVGPRPARNDIKESRARKAEESDDGRSQIAEIVKHLTPQEQARLTSRGHQSLIDAFNALPTEETAAVAFAGRAKRGWYENTTRTLGNIFGPDAPRFAATLAALSPMRAVKDNLDAAVRIWTAWHKAGRPTDEKSILNIADAQARATGAGRLMGAYRDNLVTALGHEDPVGAMLSGPKVDSFMRNLAGHTNEVTLDGWMAMHANVDEKIFKGTLKAGEEKYGKGAGYLGYAAKVRATADHLSSLTGEKWSPAEVQETVWSWAKTLYETGDALHMKPEDVLTHGILDHDLIASTPDFATLFHTDTNEAALRAAGYGEQLDALSAGRVAGATENEGPGPGGQAAPFAPKAQAAHELTAASRLGASRFGATAGRIEATQETLAERARAKIAAENAVNRTRIQESPKRQPEFENDDGNHLQNQRDWLDRQGLGWVHQGTDYSLDHNMSTGTTGDMSKGGTAARVGFDTATKRMRFEMNPDMLGEAPSTIARTFLHEHAHVIDWNGNLYSNKVEWAVKRSPDGMVPVGQAARELFALAKTDPAVGDLLHYPLDKEAYAGLHTSESQFRAELFAQAFVGAHTDYIKDVMKNEAPLAYQFLQDAKSHAALEGSLPANGKDGAYRLDQLRTSFDADRSDSSIQSAEPRGPEFERVEAVKQRQILASPARRALYGDLTKDQEDALGRTGALPPDQTLAQRVAKVRANAAMKLATGLVDEYRPIRDVSPIGYELARVSRGSDGTLEAALMFGKPFMNGDAPDVNVNDPTGGFANVMAALKGEHQRFFQWVAAQRADQLKAQGKENLYTDTDISALKSLDQGNFKDGTPRAQAYADALNGLTDYNASMLDIGRKSGIVSDDFYNLAKDQPYVPFYRVMEDKDGYPIASGGLTGQYFSKALKGGDQQLKADLLDNTMRNWAHILSASAKNRAALRTIDDNVAAGVANPVPSGTKGSVRILRDGFEEHYAMHDPYVAQALGSMNYVVPSIMKPFGVMKRVLTYGITANPIFKVRTLLRETLAATAQSDISKNAIGNLVQGWKNTDIRSQIFASTLAGGGQIRFGSMEQGPRLDAMIKRAGGIPLDEGTMAKWGRLASDVINVYHDLGNRVENVNRTALYEQMIAKGHSHLDASFAARDLLDFTNSGGWHATKFLTSSVPFMNARMQSMYALGRAYQEHPGRITAVVGGIALASLGLMLTQQDDPRFKELEDYQRDAYWHVFLGDNHYVIPKPFELGAIGTLAERSWETMFGSMNLGQWGHNFGQALLNSLALDPRPQIIKPLWNLSANKDSFNQRPIESAREQTLRAPDRFDENTSSAARMLGDMGLPNPIQLLQANYSPLSPKQIDYLGRAYFGWLATATTAATDVIARPMTGAGARPALTRSDWSGGFVRDTSNSTASAYTEELYNKAVEVHQAFASMRAAMQSGDTEKARAIQEEAMPLLRQRGLIDAAEKQMSEVSRQIQQVETSKMLGPDEKRRMLDQLSKRRNAIAARVHEAAAS